MSAVSKLKGKNKTSSESKSLMKEEGKRFLYFNVNKNFVKVNIHDILYVESIRDYIKIVTDHQTVMTKANCLTWKRLLEKLELSEFTDH